MKIETVELRRLEMPLVRPFRTSFGTQHARDVLLVKVTTPEAEGWGECVAGSAPLYSSEYVDAAADVIRQHLLPRLARLGDVAAHRLAHALEPVKGHPMAKAAVEAAVLDAELRARGISLAEHLGGVWDAVDCGVSVGIPGSAGELVDWVGGYIEEGYLRVKLKIEPGWDLEAVAAVRERFGDDLQLQVDANAAYTPADIRHLAALDAFDLLLIEQPFPEDDLLGHAELARRIETPVCLDESITSARVCAQAITLGASQIVNIKAGRVGGYLEARRIHDLCQAHGVPVWCGGMLECGVGRAANLALASLPNFTLPGDTSASDRYYATDVTEPFVLSDGRLRVPRGPGIGVTPLAEALGEMTTQAETIRLADLR